jgi:hypothetical protein
MAKAIVFIMPFIIHPFIYFLSWPDNGLFGQKKNYGIKRKRQDMHKIIFLVRKGERLPERTPAE